MVDIKVYASFMSKIIIDKIVRSKRKTLSLEINERAELVVRAPMRASLRTVEDLVREKRNWILRNQERMRVRNQQKLPKKFVAGEKFMYLGNKYPLFIIENDLGVSLMLDENFILSRKYLSKAEKVFFDWYCEQARQKIIERVQKYADEIGCQYRQINISNACKKWGSCSGKNALSFSWRLVMAPLEIIDYVVIHELTHIAEKNHSRKFWDKVVLFYPKYKECRQWLRQNGHLLNL